jgi:hypothetical protein
MIGGDLRLGALKSLIAAGTKLGPYALESVERRHGRCCNALRQIQASKVYAPTAGHCYPVPSPTRVPITMATSLSPACPSTPDF